MTETIQGAYKENPSQVLGVVAMVDDEWEQTALMEILLYAYPEDQNKICVGIKNGLKTKSKQSGMPTAMNAATLRCDKVMLRGHLYPDARLLSDVTERSSTTEDFLESQAPGPTETQLPPITMDPTWESMFIDEEELQSDCRDFDTTCMTERAKDYARQGKAHDSARICYLAWPEGTSARDECLFQAAETLANKHHDTHIETVLAMCANTHSLARSCLQHALIEATPVAVAADQIDKQTLAKAAKTTTLLHDLLRDQDDDKVISSYVWSLWTRDVYGKAKIINGDLYDVLPQEALGHARVAAAFQLMKLQPNVIYKGPVGVAHLLLDKLSTAKPLPETPLEEEGSNFGHTSVDLPAAYWGRDQREETNIPAMWCLGMGRRTYVDDLEQDTIISVLEAAARLSQPPNASFFFSVIGSKHDEKTRWTAARLGSTLHSSSVTAALVASDSSAMVQSALQNPEIERKDK